MGLISRVSSRTYRHVNMTTRQKRKEQSLREKLLSHDCLRSVLNKETLEKLPKDVQDELFKLLPETDRLAIEQGDSQSVLNNAFFNSACRLYMEKLVNSEIDLDALARKAKLNRKSNKKHDNNKSFPLKRPENSIGSSPKTSFNTPSSSTSPDSPAPKKKRRRTLAERQQFFKSRQNLENRQSYLMPAEENTVAKLSESMEKSMDLSADHQIVKKTSEDKKFHEKISLKKVTVVDYFNKSSSKTEFYSN